MKKYFIVTIILFAAFTVNAQRGVKIAYFDMEYILDKVPDYAEAKNQLEQKAQKWKQDIEVKKNDIKKLKESLDVEKALLTKELIEEREEEITFLENDLIEYQEKRFGPKGDLMSQKAVLVKPIQDQVFTIVQDLSSQRNYDFVFDKSSDLTMVFAAQKHDISDHIIRRLTRAAKREQLSSRELKKLEEKEAQEDLLEDPEYAERQKKLEDRKAERQRLLDERKAAQEARRAEAEARREELRREREAKRNGTSTSTTATPSGNRTKAPQSNTAEGENPATGGNANRPAATTPAVNGIETTDETIQGENTMEVKTTATDKPEEGEASRIDRQEAAQAAREEKLQQREAKRKAAEERKRQIMEEREAAKKARKEQNNKAGEENQAPDENQNEN